MTEAVQRIKQFERRVMWRLRWFALQDAMAWSLLLSGVVSAAIVLYIRLKPVEFRWWIAGGSIFTVVTAVLLTRLFLSRATEGDAAFVIDEVLGLEDRITTARAIVDRGGPVKEVEIALLEDSAARIERAQPATVVPYSFSRHKALALAAVLGLAVAVLVPQRTLTAARELAAERAEIQGAGEQLEQASNEVEQIAPSGSETAKLAREQAELGRALRRSNDTRAEALRKLSALGDRIRRRHDDLASTRADEVVTLAERRLGTAAVEKPKEKTSEALIPATELQASEQKAADSKERQSKSPEGGDTRVADLNKNPASAATGKDGKDKETKESQRSEKKSAEQQVASNDGRPEQTGNQKDSSKGESKAVAEPAGNPVQSIEQTKAQDSGTAREAGSKAGRPEAAEGAQSEKIGDKPGEKQPNGTGGLTGALAEQAAKALPGLSQQLLKKAAQMRAGELKPEDVKQLAQAAQLLARDLAQVAQSKEFQRAVEELAKQVTPEQIEQVARSLGDLEQVKRELEASARLMMENQEVKQMVAGLAQEFAEQRDQTRREEGGNSGRRRIEASTELKSMGSGRDTSGNKRPSPGGKYERAFGGEKLTGLGKEEKLSGKPQRGTGGEYLYLQARPGSGASRSTYESSYPQYRREAERSVERSQVPLKMRSVVRDYFDAINPDAKRKP